MKFYYDLWDMMNGSMTENEKLHLLVHKFIIFMFLFSGVVETFIK